MTKLEVLLGSKQLKLQIIKRSEELEIPLRFICKKLNIDYVSFMNGYINSVSNDVFEVEEKKFEAFMGFLGIKIQYQFIINTKFNADEVRQELKDYYEQQKENNSSKAK